jgi:hypothetical protein
MHLARTFPAALLLAFSSSSALAQEASTRPESLALTPSAVEPVTADVPTGYHVERRSHEGFVAGGAAVFTLSYLTSVVTGAILANTISGANASYSGEWGCTPHCSLAPTIPFFVPGAGPFILAGEAGNGPLAGVAVADGLLQLGGIAMLAYGLAAPKTVLARDRSTATHFQVMPVPLVTNGGSGAAIVGTF